jgi:hypothetical protein
LKTFFFFYNENALAGVVVVNLKVVAPGCSKLLGKYSNAVMANKGLGMVNAIWNILWPFGIF